MAFEEGQLIEHIVYSLASQRGEAKKYLPDKR